MTRKTQKIIGWIIASVLIVAFIVIPWIFVGWHWPVIILSGITITFLVVLSAFLIIDGGK